ncbi:hypothetical protein TNCV_1650101 [Trichonephila clavipes]|nr:hypothetical protein TNCV_1650101 [Trichonephila clavipes]
MVKRRGRHLSSHPPLLTTSPHQREDVGALDRFNVYRFPALWVFSGTGSYPMFMSRHQPFDCRFLEFVRGHCPHIGLLEKVFILLPHNSSPKSLSVKPLLSRSVLNILTKFQVYRSDRRRLNSFIREDQTFWVFWADLEKPSLNCWAAEDMLWRQLNIRAVWAMICVTSLFVR